MNCKCPPGSPFHWDSPDYRSGIDWSSFAHAAKSSKTASQVVDSHRLKGRNTSTILMQSKRGYVPNHMPTSRLVPTTGAQRKQENDDE